LGAPVLGANYKAIYKFQFQLGAIGR